METYRLLIDNCWRTARSEEQTAVVNPATEEVWAYTAEADPYDVDLAVTAARRAFDGGWPGVTARDRAAILRRVGDRIRARRSELAQLEVMDCGKPLGEALADVDEAAFMFEYYAGLALSRSGDVPIAERGVLSLVLNEPVGVVAAITAWNAPLLLAAQKTAPAVAAGCCVVLKPAEQAPVTTLELGRILVDVGLQPGVVNVVTGVGGVAGKALVQHPGVDKISFTGSLQTGRWIAATAGDGLKRVTLELGGKSPNLVFPSADTRRAVAGTAFGVFLNQGENCSAGTRVFVDEELYPAFVEQLKEEANAAKLGNGLDPATTMGPLISAAQRSRVAQLVESGIRDGATRIAGSDIPGGPGFYFPPTVLIDVDDRMPVMRDEIFGPVAAVSPFSTEEEAVSRANDTYYGLAASVWTQDIDQALRVAQRVRAGTVWINDSQQVPSEAIWGGFKASGSGRELGPWGLDAYYERKQIYMKIAEAGASR